MVSNQHTLYVKIVFSSTLLNIISLGNKTTNVSLFLSLCLNLLPHLILCFFLPLLPLSSAFICFLFFSSLTYYFSLHFLLLCIHPPSFISVFNFFLIPKEWSTHRFGDVLIQSLPSYISLSLKSFNCTLAF